MNKINAAGTPEEKPEETISRYERTQRMIGNTSGVKKGSRPATIENLRALIGAGKHEVRIIGEGVRGLRWAVKNVDANKGTVDLWAQLSDGPCDTTEPIANVAIDPVRQSGAYKGQ